MHTEAEHEIDSTVVELFQECTESRTGISLALSSDVLHGHRVVWRPVLAL